ncbi:MULTISPECIES: hypothetical protein [Brasilonema]|nr:MULTISPECIES: hypothetical protein [Brasilonema]
MNANAEQISFRVPLSFEAHGKAEKHRKGISNPIELNKSISIF